MILFCDRYQGLLKEISDGTILTTTVLYIWQIKCFLKSLKILAFSGLLSRTVDFNLLCYRLS